MESEKNLHAAIPATLLTRAQQAAQQEHISLDELVRDAMESCLNRREFDEVITFGTHHSKARGLKPTDVESAIAHHRAKNRPAQ